MLLYVLFAAMVLLLWKKPMISLVGACGVGLFALYLGRIAPLGYGLFLLLLGGIYLYYKHALPSWGKGVLGVLIAGASFLFYKHFVPGFDNWMIVDQYQVSSNAWPFRLYLNSDKIMVAITLIALGHRLNHSWEEWSLCFRSAIAPILILTVVLMGTAFALDYATFDPKISPILWLWLPTNLLFVCVAEEALFRGFVQKELAQCLAKVKGGQVLAIIIASIFFGLYHFEGGPYYMLLAAVAGLGYGYAYNKTQRLEASIITHFLVNLMHILFFTYPALMR